jgi:hypothetical protein
MGDKDNDFLRQAVEILQSYEVENFLIIAENPGSKGKQGDDFRAAYGGKQSVIVAMLMEVFQGKKDNLSLILDAFLSLGHIDKTGQREDLEEVLERLRRE